MDWNNSRILGNSSFVSHPPQMSSTNILLHNSNQFGCFRGMEMVRHDNDHPVHEIMASQNTIIPPIMEEMMRDDDEMMIMRYDNQCHQEKIIKRRLTAKQVESLENSFEEEKKLEPERKRKLASDLGLQPRQVAVWFQNRRARWKAKKLEHLYDALKQQFDVVSKEKLMLQHEVKRLKSMLMEEAIKKQVYSGYTEASYEEISERTSAADHNRDTSNNAAEEAIISREQNKVGGHYLFNNVDVYNTFSPSYWGALA